MSEPRAATILVKTWQEPLICCIVRCDPRLEAHVLGRLRTLRRAGESFRGIFQALAPIRAGLRLGVENRNTVDSLKISTQNYLRRIT